MRIKEIIAISGQPGLFKYVSQGKSGLIVEAFSDKKRTTVPPAARVNTLGDVVVFTDADEMPLHKILWAIRDKQNGQPAPDGKKATEAELREFFAVVLPSYDRDRCHLSDIRKIFTWYNILQINDLLNFEVDEDADGADTNTSDAVAADRASAAQHKPVQQSTQRASTKAAGSAKILAPRKAQ
jgi:hypothetical protein